MNNEQENRELQQSTPMVTPPPFRQHDEPQLEATSPEQSASPTLADRIAALGLDEETADKLRQLTDGIDGQTVTTELLSTLAQGVTHDTDVHNADATGYLRGRNEKIEAVLHPQPEEEQETPEPVFPHYSRRSIWD